jgi:hypothetical protein
LFLLIPPLVNSRLPGEWGREGLTLLLLLVFPMLLLLLLLLLCCTDLSLTDPVLAEGLCTSLAASSFGWLLLLLLLVAVMVVARLAATAAAAAAAAATDPLAVGLVGVSRKPCFQARMAVGDTGADATAAVAAAAAAAAAAGEPLVFPSCGLSSPVETNKQ